MAQVGRGEAVDSFDPTALRRLRQARNLSHDALAAAVGSNRSTLIAYEKGRRRPGIPALAAIAKALDVGPLELTTVTDATATLADLRTRAALPKAELAAQLGLARSTWDQIERGTRTLQPAIASRLAELLDVDVKAIAAAHQRGIRSAP